MLKEKFLLTKPITSFRICIIDELEHEIDNYNY
jgi:hypothetical protein